MTSPSLPDVFVRRRAWILTAGLAAAAYDVSHGSQGAGTHGRGLVVTLLLALGSAAWLAWAWVDPTTKFARPLLVTLGITGGLLTAAASSGAACAYMFVAVVSAGTLFNGRGSALVLASTIAALTLGSIAYDQSAIGVIAYGAGLVAAALAAANRRVSILRSEQAELLLAQTQRSNEEQLRAAALDERARIAREIHDVLAHSLAGLTIDLEATRVLVEHGASTDRILARVDRAHGLAREGLSETRRAIETLRGEGLQPGPTLKALAAEYRDSDAGDAHVELRGPVDELPADAALAVARVAQESLTNVRKHAPGAAV